MFVDQGLRQLRAGAFLNHYYMSCLSAFCKVIEYVVTS